MVTPYVAQVSLVLVTHIIVSRGGGGGGLPYKKEGGCSSDLVEVKKGGFRTSQGVQPQKVHSGSFYSNFEPKKYEYFLGVAKISSHAHKTGSWYLLGVLFKISDAHPPSFFYGSSPPGDSLRYVLFRICIC